MPVVTRLIICPKCGYQWFSRLPLPIICGNCRARVIKPNMAKAPKEK